MKNKYKSFLIIVFCLILSVVLIGMGILSTKTSHTDHCGIPDCPLCKLISLSIDFIRSFGLIFIYVFTFLPTIFLAKFISKNVKKIQKLTLVELKVIQIK